MKLVKHCLLLSVFLIIAVSLTSCQTKPQSLNLKFEFTETKDVPKACLPVEDIMALRERLIRCEPGFF